MTREAVVQEVRDGKALVCTSDTGECGTCEARHACMTLSGNRSEGQEFWVDNAAGASPGDMVRLELRSSSSLVIIVSTFLLPIVMLFLGYFLSINGGDSHRALGAGAGFLVGVVMVVVINRRLQSRKSFNMQIVRILEKKDGGQVPQAGPDSHMEG